MATRLRVIPSTDPRLKRYVEHDEASRAYALPTEGAIDKSTWTDKRVRLYDPVPNPEQTIGNCTMCAEAMVLNAVGNRRTGVVLNMDWALRGYEWETANDEFPGQWPPDDTGSSGLSAAKAAQHSGDGGVYQWIFGGADGVVQAIMSGRAISVGTTWYDAQFTGSKLYYGKPVVAPGGSIAGGHQYVAHGYAHASDRVLFRCWWGPEDGSLDVHRDFWMSRGDLNDLLADQGDAHWQVRT